MIELWIYGMKCKNVRWVGDKNDVHVHGTTSTSRKLDKTPVKVSQYTTAI